jgi:hypothetical protein
MSSWAIYSLFWLKKLTPPGLIDKYSIWLGSKLYSWTDRKNTPFRLDKRTPPEMEEANFPVAGKQTTPRLGKTNFSWADRKISFLAKKTNSS